MKNRLIILDFDRTTFDSGRFYADMRSALEQEFGIVPGKLEFEQSGFMLASDHSYDFFAHAKSLGLDKAKASELLRARFGDNRYLFSDVMPFLQRHHNENTEIIILTVGVSDWQQFKLSLCPKLVQYAQHIIPIHKGAHLASQDLHRESGRLSFDLVEPDTFKEIWLIDDKPSTFSDLESAPEGFKLYRLRRPDDLRSHESSPEHTLEISSLDEL